MHSKRKIPDSWRTGWKEKACTSFALYLKVFKNHLYYLWHVRVLFIKPCLHTHKMNHSVLGVQVLFLILLHSFRSIIEATENFPGLGAFDHLEWTYDGTFEQFFGFGRGNLNKNIPKTQMPGGLTGTLQFVYRPKNVGRTNMMPARKIIWLEINRRYCNTRR